MLRMWLIKMWTRWRRGVPKRNAEGLTVHGAFVRALLRKRIISLLVASLYLANWKG